MKMALENPMGGNFDGEFERDIDALVREQNQNRGAFDLDWNELDILRSGSAPPTVEGSRTTSASLFGHGDFSEINCRLSGQDSGGFLSEEDLRSHPAYLSYYYSNENHNPRMPPPAISKEDWRVQQRFHPRGSSFGGIGDRRQRKESAESDGQISSLFFLQSGKDMVEQSRGMLPQNCQEQSEEWLECRSDGLMGLHDVVGLGMRRKSFADVLQEEIGHPSTVTGQLSRPVSHNAYGNIDPLRASGHISRPASRNAYENVDSIRDSDLSIMQLQNGLGFGGMQSGTTSSGLTHGQSIGSSMISHSYASALGSISRSTTPDPSLIQRSSSPCLPPVGVKIGDSNRPKGFTGTDDLGDIAASLSDLSLSSKTEKDGENHATSLLNEEFSNQCELHYDVHGDKRQFLQQKIIEKSQAALKNLPIDSGYSDSSKKTGNLADIDLVKLTMNGPKNMTKQTSNSNIYKNVPPDFSRSNSKVYNGTRGVQVMLNNQFDKEEQYVNSTGNQVGTGLHGPSMESLYTQYLHGASDSLVHATGRLDPYLGRSYIGASQMDLPECQKAYLETLFAQQKLQYDTHLKYGGLNHGFYGNHAFGIGIPFLGSPLSSSNHSSLGFGSPMRQNERSSHSTSTTRSVHGDSIGPWSMENGATREGFMSSLLEEFKNNRTQSFELSDIVGYVVEFSADQYGSRFIQQKLESASVAEKRKIFPEILPRAHSLMSDVFGNYVIQKFFEYGTEDQKKQLASRLKGHVLPLSLQMYGCRVIQKALEVVDVDQQTEMVLELDGHIMKCVRDQNGNHVIQKCIECVPQGKIQFIIESFYGHVVALSTHPYGCRVIQRVLEHCDDPKTQSIMMDEIMRSVCTLAQDQYGNYVIQHVLQRGKPEERTAIISNLAGQIVKMSQQKYASNVIEKCLTYGSIEERQLLINEMLGSTDENEPLQAMMKDQFANYVVQKVIETSDDRNRELILSRIKVHLNALKRYTYGKHIVTRVEKLVAAGEKRIGVPSNSS